MQGHAQTARAMGSGYPCPQLDFTGGFNDWFAAAFNLPEGTSVEDRYGSAFNPFLNDQNYLLSVVTSSLCEGAQTARHSHCCHKPPSGWHCSQAC